VVACPAEETPTETAPRLRIVSYNIQAGIATSRYHQYVTHSWKHVLPYRRRAENLDRIAELIRDFDLVGLQEVDAGSLRSRFVNQVGYLSTRAGFTSWYHQTNRDLGKLGQHSIGLLSRIPIAGVCEHRLPGTIPGRGVLVARLGEGTGGLTLMIMHLSLGRRARLRQLDYVADLVREYPDVILMGDLNCRSESGEMIRLVERSGLSEPVHGLLTFPSWRPNRNLDHILVSPSLRVVGAGALAFPFSDHLPIAAVVVLPERLRSIIRPASNGAA
jgi:endonuclease/exonuclease/phosphatase family metal-dependent hydrolase